MGQRRGMQPVLSAPGTEIRREMGYAGCAGDRTAAVSVFQKHNGLGKCVRPPTKAAYSSQAWGLEGEEKEMSLGVRTPGSHSQLCQGLAVRARGQQYAATASEGLGG